MSTRTLFHLTEYTLRSWIKLVKPSLILSNNPSTQDGTGAQLARTVSVIATALYCRLPFYFTPLKSVCVTPLDSFQTEGEMKAYTKVLNEIISGALASQDLHTSKLKHSDVYKIKDLNIRSLIILSIKSRLTQRSIEVSCDTAFAISELNVGIMQLCNEFFESLLVEIACRLGEPRQREIQIKMQNAVILHYRLGISKKEVVKGEEVPRWQTERYFLNALQELLSAKEERSNFSKILVLTDAPSTRMKYKPLESQLEFWKTQTDGILGDSIWIEGDSLDWIADLKYKKKGITIEILRGGNPLEAFYIMSKSRALIISYSSFSYLAALVGNVQRVYCPPRFLHQLPQNWVKVKDH